MSLKAVLLNFSGVVIKDESIHQQLIEEILIGENLRPSDSEYREVCLGKSDRTCLGEILARRGRVVSQAYLQNLLLKKAQAYQQQLEALEKLPLYRGIKDFLIRLNETDLKVAIVTGRSNEEVELVLKLAELSPYISTVIISNDLQASRPEPDVYFLAIERLNQKNRGLCLEPCQCLAVENTRAGIKAAKEAKIQVVGVANTYPFHLLQRWTNWTVDALPQLELERVEQSFSQPDQDQ